MTHTSLGRSANMNKENAVGTKSEAPTIRITRSRSKALGTSTGMLPSSRPSFKQEQKRTVCANAKRSASDENKGTMVGNAGKQHKKRTVLNDVTNIFCENSYSNCLNATKAQTSRQGRKRSMKKDRDVHQSGAVQIMQEDVQAEFVEELSKIKVAESMEIAIPDKWAKRENSEHSISLKDTVAESSRKPRDEFLRTYEEEFICGEKSAALVQPSIVDIDSKLEDPQACTPYALDIYNYKRSTELERRPSTIYMETLQKDVTPTMRGILVDWLVEVSEEYKLVPDTLYLTVNLIDRFLSQKFIEKQRLQLLGVTCMLIASKYEEICPPRVEEFCFITDNTYTSLEVLKMESQVLNLLHFQLSVPTIKTFLRRFVQAAQVSSEVPSVELEYLANYLAELTLVEYSFLKFLPSLMAASAVLLARWTLNQSDNPWNLTLEHYTKYKASELKAAVLALEDLQLNTSGSTLNAIREKYRQQKFKCVATLTPSEPALSLFQRFNYG